MTPPHVPEERDSHPQAGPVELRLGMAERASRWPDTALSAILTVCAILPYANTLLNGFVYDDTMQVTKNPYLHSFRHLPQVFSTTVWSYVGAEGVTNYYRPMMTLGYLVCYQLFGPVAYEFHLVNLIIHAAVVMVLFALTRRMFDDRRLAFLASLLFALHPIHVESVAWIAAVTDLELTFFYLLTFWCYLGVERVAGADGAASPRPGRTGLKALAMTLCYVLALFSKEQALTLPFLVTAWEHFFRGDRHQTGWKEKVSRYGILWLLAIAYVVFRMRFFGSFAPASAHPKFSWIVALLSAFALAGQYVGDLFWPAHLNAFHMFHKSVSVFDGRVIAGLVVLVGVAAAFFRLYTRPDESGQPEPAQPLNESGLYRKARSASFGILWFLATLGPVLNVRWMPVNAFAERYLYLPSTGFCWMAAWAGLLVWDRASRVPWINPRVSRAALIAVLSLVVALSAIRIWTRDRDWHDDITLFTGTLATAPDAYPIRNNLGVVYWNRGDASGAEREWRKALPGDPKSVIILNNLGLVCDKQKRYDEAVAFFRRAIELKPNFTNPHVNLGVVEEEMGRRQEAQTQYEIAVQLSPLNTEARNGLGKVYFDQGRFAEAAKQFLESVRSAPNAKAYDYLGDIDLDQGDRQRAVQAYKAALEANPFDSHAHFQLGAIELAAGGKAEALREYQAGLETDPLNPEALAVVQKLRGRKNN